MINKYFQDELAHLRELGEEFSRAHPALAPMLIGSSTDPDVERLLEGVAFLTGLLREKLDDDFPEIIHELIRLLWPHYLRPVPCATIMAFKPKPTVKQTMRIPAGVQVSSLPVEGTSCVFRTCYDVELHPLHILDAKFIETGGRPPAVEISLELRGPNLSDWQPQALRFYLAGTYGLATEMYLLLRHYLKRIVVMPEEGGSTFVLLPDDLKPVGFSDDEELIPYPTHSFPGYRILQEFFWLPEKFLFLEIAGWERWVERGSGTRFEIRFELDPFPFPAPRIKRNSFVLSAVPAINVFPFDADPIRLDHRATEYAVRPAGANADHYQVYGVEEVKGFVQGTAEERTYLPFEMFSSDFQATPVYRLKTRKSLSGETIDSFISVAYPKDGGVPAIETLSIGLSCTNGRLPENLQVGDISRPTTSTPEFVEFENIVPVTNNVLPPLGSNLLWRLLSHLSLNYVSLAKADNLRALLEFYIFQDSRDRGIRLANQKRILGIEDLQAQVSNRLVSGVMLRGQEITIKMRQDHFAGPGDLFLFGCILDYFLGTYASINSYTKLYVDEAIKGERYQWPPRVGDHPLI
jgi:type VI secretion system protein ImpG